MNDYKGKVEEFTEAVSKILYIHDPVGLVQYGVPDDEYDAEARAIISKLRDVTDMRSLRWIVYDVFKDFFNKDTILPRSDKCYGLIAEKIWDVWQEVIED